VGAAVVRHINRKARAGFLDGCTGEEIDHWGWDRYREQGVRKGAAAALGGVRFYRDTVLRGSGRIDAGTRLLSLSGIDYVTTTTADFGASDLSSRADVRAVNAGKASQVGANQIRRFQRPSDSFDPTIKVNNDAPMAGGEEAEDDDTYKERLRRFWLAARRGTIPAIEFGALQVPGVVSARAIEALTPGGFPARVLSLYIADSSGVASDQLARSVGQALLEWRGGGIAVIVFTSLPQIVQVRVRLSFRANAATATLAEAVRAAMVEFVNSLEVNEPLLVKELGSVLARFRDDGVIADDQSILLPVGDLVPAPGLTIRTTLGDVTVE
jgi:uncharacterized phage protein gp47/JayE